MDPVTRAALTVAQSQAQGSPSPLRAGTVTELVFGGAVVAVDGGGEARPALIGHGVVVVGDRVVILFDPADNGVAYLIGSPGPAFTPWTPYTPTLTQGAAVAKTVTYAKYCQIGKVVTCQVRLACTGAGTGANKVVVGLPITAATSGIAVGNFWIVDASVSGYVGVAHLDSTTGVTGFIHTATTAIGANPNFALANTDSVIMSVSYEAA